MRPAPPDSVGHALRSFRHDDSSPREPFDQAALFVEAVRSGPALSLLARDEETGVLHLYWGIAGGSKWVSGLSGEAPAYAGTDFIIAQAQDGHPDRVARN